MLPVWSAQTEAIWMEANGWTGAIAMDESEDGIYCKGPCHIYWVMSSSECEGSCPNVNDTCPELGWYNTLPNRHQVPSTKRPTTHQVGCRFYPCITHFTCNLLRALAHKLWHVLKELQIFLQLWQKWHQYMWPVSLRCPCCSVGMEASGGVDKHQAPICLMLTTFWN